MNAKKSITQEVWNAHFIIEDSCIKGDLLFTNSPLHCIYILKTAITSQFYIKMLWLVFCILLILYGELWQSYVFCLYCMVSCDSHNVSYKFWVIFSSVYSTSLFDICLQKRYSLFIEIFYRIASTIILISCTYHLPIFFWALFLPLDSILILHYKWKSCNSTK